MELSGNRFTALKENSNIFKKKNKFNIESNNSSINNKFIQSSNNEKDNRWGEFKIDIDNTNREREERNRERNTFRRDNNRNDNYRRSFFRRETRPKTPPPKEFKLEEEDFPSL